MYINQGDDEGKTPLHLAMNRRKFSRVLILLKYTLQEKDNFPQSWNNRVPC